MEAQVRDQLRQCCSGSKTRNSRKHRYVRKHLQSRPTQPELLGYLDRHIGSRFACEADAGTSYPELEKMLDEKKNSSGSEEVMKVSFRDVDTFSLWIWLEHHKVLTEKEKELLETVLESWFVVGRMGGFNCMNLQVSENAAGNASFYRYDSGETYTALQALFMDYAPLETQGKWSRFWVNMGTADEIALDILINSLTVFSQENLGIKQMIVGGLNDDWDVPQMEAPLSEEELKGQMPNQ